MESLLGHDARLGRRVHLHGSRQPFSAIAEAIAMSADEIVWFPLPVVLLALGLIDTIPGWDFYGDVCMMAACEQTLKFFCRRTRPHYAKQGTFYCLPGEWFSFPSGHTMRAAYFSLRLPHYLPSFSSSSWILTAWAVLVAWSRVVKGRHFPLDVLGGFGAGLLLGSWAESIDPQSWAAVKYPAGICLCLQVVVLALVPKWRLAGTYIHFLCGSAWLFSLQYVESPRWVKQLL